MFKTRMNSNALIGIDFGSNSIKAIALTKGGGTFRIDAVAEAPVAKGLIVDHHFEDISRLTEIIKHVSKNFPSSYQNAAIAVSGMDVITKVIAMNSDLSELELEAQVEIEAESSIPFPLDEIFLDFEVIGPNVNSKDSNDILISAARKQTVLAQVDCIEDAGLKVKIVDIASHALARACELEFSPEDYEKGVAVVDIGASQMMLNILHQGNVIFSRSKNHGGDICTQMMSEHYGMKENEAEKRKINKDWPAGCDVDVIAPFVSMTVNHLRYDLRMFTNAPNNIGIEKIILTGGCQLMPELLQQLQEDLDIDVEIANPFIGFEYKNPSDKTLLHKHSAKYMMALGLALREANNV